MMLAPTYQKYRTVSVSMMASLTFIALAIWGWGVAIEDVLVFLLMLLSLLAVVIAMAAVFISFFIFAKKYFQKESNS